MKTRIETLIEKYWEAETSLEDEKELKALLKDAEGYNAEKVLFGIVEDFKREEPQQLQIPAEKPARRIRMHWLGWAASVAILAGSIWIWQDYEQKSKKNLPINRSWKPWH